MYRVGSRKQEYEALEWLGKGPLHSNTMLFIKNRVLFFYILDKQEQ